MPSFLVTVTPRLPAAQLHHPEDRAYNPEGQYGFDCPDLQQALHQFRVNVPIGCLEDFQIVCEPATGPIDSALRRTQESWARQWFNGTERCPRCGSDDHSIVAGGTDIDEYHCATTTCSTSWRVLRTVSALLPFDDARSTHVPTDWIEPADVAADPRLGAYRGLAELVQSLVYADPEDWEELYLPRLQEHLRNVRAVDPPLLDQT